MVVHRADDVTADVTVEMGKVNRLGVGPAVVGGRRFTGLGVDVGNPHLACVDPDLTDAELAALDVGAPVEFDHDQFPMGSTSRSSPRPGGRCDHDAGPRTGVGETRSCGTGTVAAAAAALAHRGEQTGTLRVRIPGGEVSVEVSDSTSFLRGLRCWWRAASSPTRGGRRNSEGDRGHDNPMRGVVRA